MPPFVRNLYTVLVFVICGVLTSVHIATQLNPGAAVIDMPPEALFRIFMGGRQTSTLSLYSGEERFGSAVVQTSLPTGHPSMADLRIDASGSPPVGSQRATTWTTLLRLRAERETARVRSFSAEFQLRETDLTIRVSGTADSRTFKLSILQKEQAVFDFEGTPAELLSRAAAFVGWTGQIPVGGLFETQTALRAVRTSRKIGGDRIEVIEAGFREDRLNEAKLIMTQVGQVIYVRLPGGYDAVLDGLAEIDFNEIRSSK